MDVRQIVSDILAIRIDVSGLKEEDSLKEIGLYIVKEVLKFYQVTMLDVVETILYLLKLLVSLNSSVLEKIRSKFQYIQQKINYDTLLGIFFSLNVR